MRHRNREQRKIKVGKALYKRYQSMREASRGVNSNYAAGEARELHYKIFYSDYRPYPGEDTVSVPHPILGL
jgi:hypothetical protein